MNASNRISASTGPGRALLAIALAGFLGVPAAASAVDFYGSASAGWSSPIYPPGGGLPSGSTQESLVFSGIYQPRSGAGLTAASAQVDISAYGASANAAIAVYGTDSSRSAASRIDPNLIVSGLGVEPMIDIQLDSQSGSVVDDFGDPWDVGAAAAASAHISVQHRVGLNPAITIPDNILGDVLSRLNSVPLEVHWAYSVTGYGTPSYSDYVPSARFIMHVTSSTGDCAGYFNGVCGGFDFENLGPNSSNSGTMPFTAVATTDARTAIYEISLDGGAGVGYGGGGLRAGNGWVQAVIDPYLTVDPNWEYAPYFLVEQESTINEGEWVPVTRNYLSAVPLPPSVWLLASGLLGLIGVARRNTVRGRT